MAHISLLKLVALATLLFASVIAQDGGEDPTVDNAGETEDTIQLEHCAEQSNPPLQCAACGDGKSLKDDHLGCIDCPEGCSECYEETDEAGAATGTIHCSTCENNEDNTYILGSDHLCKACSTGCKSCQLQLDDETLCTKCYDGYFMKFDGTNTCGACSSGCSLCDDDGSGKGACREADDGHYLPVDLTKACPSCDEGCITCSGVGECSLCDEGYMLKDGACNECPWGCDRCEEDEAGEVLCVMCMEGYGVKTFTTCDYCDIANCISCNLDGECTGCEDEYALNPDKNICTACPSNCNSCAYNSGAAAVFCSNDCEEGFVTNPNTGACEACDVNCEEPDQNCEWVTDYVLYNYDDSIKQAVSGPVCNRCKVFYGLTITGTCKACPEGCIACHDCYLDYEEAGFANCFTCIDTAMDSSYLDEEAGCTVEGWRCPIGGGDVDVADCIDQGYDPIGDFHLGGPDARLQYPYRYADEGETTYTDSCCMKGYGAVVETPSGFSNDIVNCEKCVDPYCLECDGDATDCDTCIVGYGFNDDNECTKCTVENCRDCSSNIEECNNCFMMLERDGYVVSTEPDGDTACLACPDNCEYDYNRDNDCWFWSNPDGSESAVCPPQSARKGYGSIMPGYEVKKCSDNCWSCHWISDADSDEEQCIECAPGNVLDEFFHCRECPAHCSLCSWDSGMARVECSPGGCGEGYVMDELTGQCTVCTSGCDECTFVLDESPSCTACTDGYTINDEEHKCYKCPTHCNSCYFDYDTHTAKCDSSNDCDVGYGTKSDGKCHDCPRQCKRCEADQDNILKCDVCRDTYFLNMQICGRCPTGCKTCVEKSGTMTCSDCLTGYVYNPSIQICSKCPSDCESCVLVQGSPQCKKCSEGFILSDGVCTACSSIAGDNCGECTEVNAAGKSQCLECEDGYALDDAGVCTACSEGLDNCAVCEDREAVCDTCEDGYEPFDGYCGFSCFICDGLDDCSSIEDANNTMMEQCFDGACKVVRVTDSETGSVSYERGCMQNTCEGDMSEGKVCTEELKSGSNYTVETCEQCCMSDECNTMEFLSAAPRWTMSILNLMAFILIAFKLA